MSLPDECKHGLASGTCSLCRPAPTPRPAQGSTSNPDFLEGTDHFHKLASFDGVCPACGEYINAGLDNISQDGDGAWVHEECA